MTSINIATIVTGNLQPTRYLSLKIEIRNKQTVLAFDVIRSHLEVDLTSVIMFNVTNTMTSCYKYTSLTHTRDFLNNN